MQPGVQRCGVEPIVAVADSLDGDFPEDRQVGPGSGLVEPWQDCGGSSGLSPGIVSVGPTSPSPEAARNVRSMDSPIVRRSRKMVSST
jgi:hypothetical protein